MVILSINWFSLTKYKLSNVILFLDIDQQENIVVGFYIAYVK